MKAEVTTMDKQTHTCGTCGRILGPGYYYTCHVCGLTYCYTHKPEKCDHMKLEHEGPLTV
jgi:hypothetical protein